MCPTQRGQQIGYRLHFFNLFRMQWLHNGQGQLDGAESCCRRAIAISMKTNGAEHLHTIAFDGTLATTQLVQGDQGAVNELQRTVSRLQAQGLPSSHELVKRFEEALRGSR